MKPIMVSGVIAGLAIAMSGQMASADETPVMCTRSRSCSVTAKKPGEVGAKSATDVGRESDQGVQNDRIREAAEKRRAVLAAYEREFDAFTRCINTSLDKAVCGSGPVPPQFGSDTMSSRGNGIPISAGQAAAIAVARLQLPTVAPGIGPSPDLNPWNIAAVGYPLWLWADGPTHVRVRSKHEKCHGESRHLRQDLV
jgi:hypothetical protein